MSLAVNNASEEREFTTRYAALMRHYRMAGQKIQTGKPNENGDVEQRHYRLKCAVAQALMLRNSCDFGSMNEYKDFLSLLLAQLNAGRRDRLRVEMQYLQKVPGGRLESIKREWVKVDSGRGSEPANRSCRRRKIARPTKRPIALWVAVRRSREPRRGRRWRASSSRGGLRIR